MRCLNPNCESENTVEIGGVANSSTLVRCLDCNQTSWHPAKSIQPTAPLYRIYWRIGANGQPHCGTGTFERELAELWVNNLNADKDNRAVGLFYWMEAEGEYYEHNKRLEDQGQDNQP